MLEHVTAAEITTEKTTEYQQLSNPAGNYVIFFAQSETIQTLID